MNSEIIRGVESDGTPGQSVLHEDMIWEDSGHKGFGLREKTAIC